MVKKNLGFKKKSQAAIEFLMTYGWMLLVVLIVGALIFSFVDFGGLLPSQVDVSPPLRGESVLVSADSTSGEVQFIVTYINAKGSTIAFEDAELLPDLSTTNCDISSLRNVDTTAVADAVGEKINVINGHKVNVKFNCGSDLISGDVFEGEAKFKVIDTQTSFESTSRGRIRVSVD